MFTTYVFWCFLGLIFVNPIQSNTLLDQNSSFLSLNQILYVGGTGPGNYSRIQFAIDNASVGATIFVYDYSSPYYENVLIDKSVTIIGENRETTIIDGSSSNHVLFIVANEVRISNLTIQDSGSGWSNVGVYIIGTDVIVENNIIQYNTNGIFIEGASYNFVLNNTIKYNIYHAVRMEYTSQNYILDNMIIDNDNGIYMWESPENVIARNVIEANNWEGIILGEYCDDNIIYHNDFIDNKVEHAYDLSNNIWDGGNTQGGNYWDDYTGEDLDNDGFGDVPYIIRGPHAVDHYPLMWPYGSDIPDVEIDISGGLGITVRIDDLRENSSDSLQIDIWFNYSYRVREVLFPGIDPFIHLHWEYSICDNGFVMLKSLPPFLFGLGTAGITVQVASLIKTAEKQVISWFVL